RQVFRDAPAGARVRSLGRGGCEGGSGNELPQVVAGARLRETKFVSTPCARQPPLRRPPPHRGAACRARPAGEPDRSCPKRWHFLGGRRLGLYNPQRLRTARNTPTTQEERGMIPAPGRMAAIFVDRSCTDHWVVRDPDGNFWIVPPVE